MAFAPPRTPTVQQLKALVTSNDCIGINHDVACATMQIAPFFPAFTHPPIIDGRPLKDSQIKHEAYVMLGSNNWYDIENQTANHFRQFSVEKTIHVRAVRSVGNNYTVVALENCIDEVANEIGEDPLARRIEKLIGKGVTSGTSLGSKTPE